MTDRDDANDPARAALRDVLAALGAIGHTPPDSGKLLELVERAREALDDLERATVPSLLDLPSEILRAVLSHVRTRASLLALSATCRGLRDGIGGDDDLWKRLYTMDPISGHRELHESVAALAVAPTPERDAGSAVPRISLWRWLALAAAPLACGGSIGTKALPSGWCRSARAKHDVGIRLSAKTYEPGPFPWARPADYAGEWKDGLPDGWGILFWSSREGLHRVELAHAGRFCRGLPDGVGERRVSWRYDSRGMAGECVHATTWKGTWYRGGRFAGLVVESTDGHVDCRFEGWTQRTREQGLGLRVAMDWRGDSRQLTKVYGCWDRGVLDPAYVFGGNGETTLKFVDAGKDPNDVGGLILRSDAIWIVGAWDSERTGKMDRAVLIRDRCFVGGLTDPRDDRRGFVLWTAYASGDAMEGVWAGNLCSPDTWRLRKVRWFFFSARCPDPRFCGAAIAHGTRWKVRSKDRPWWDPRFKPRRDADTDDRDRRLFSEYVRSGFFSFGEDESGDDEGDRGRVSVPATPPVSPAT